eukprot:UN16303
MPHGQINFLNYYDCFTETHHVHFLFQKSYIYIMKHQTLDHKVERFFVKSSGGIILPINWRTLFSGHHWAPLFIILCFSLKSL